MMKKFEEYLIKRIKELQKLKNNYNRMANCNEFKDDARLSNRVSARQTVEVIAELKTTLYHFMQSVEAQSVADNECEKKQCNKIKKWDDCPEIATESKCMGCTGWF